VGFVLDVGLQLFKVYSEVLNFLLPELLHLVQDGLVKLEGFRRDKRINLILDNLSELVDDVDCLLLWRLLGLG